MITHRDRGIVCDLCGEELPDKRALITHKASHANLLNLTQSTMTEKIFPCSNCGKVSS